MTIRKIAQSTTSLAVSATTTQSGIFKTVAQQLSGIDRLENLSSLLVPKVADVSAKLIARLLYDTDGFGTRLQYDYIFVTDPTRLSLSKPFVETLVYADHILLNITSFREFFDGLGANEIIQLLLSTTRTDTASVTDARAFLATKLLRDTGLTADRQNIWINKVFRDTTPALDLLNVFDGITYNWIMQRFETVPVGSPAATRYSGNVLENTRFFINKPRTDTLASNDVSTRRINKTFVENLAHADRILLNITSFRSFFDGLGPDEIIELLLFTTRTFDNSIDISSRPSKLVLKAPILDSQNVLDQFRLIRGLPRADNFTSTDRQNIWFNKVLEDTTPALDLLNVFDGITYNWIMQRFEAVTIGSPAATRYAGNALENTSFFINKSAKQGNLTTVQQGNLLPYSEAINLWINNGTGVPVSANTVIAPNGTLTADFTPANTSNFTRYISAQSAINSGNIVTYSIHVKPTNTSASFVLYADGNFGPGNAFAAAIAVVTPSTLAVSGLSGALTGTISPIGSDGWYRASITFKTLSTGGVNCHVYLIGNANSYAWWGAQLEHGFYATNYIPTNTSAVILATNTASDSDIVRTGDTPGFKTAFNVLEATPFIVSKHLRIDIQPQDGVFKYLAKTANPDALATTDTEAFWFNKLLTESGQALDLLNVFDGLTYASYMQRFENITMGSPAATRYSGNNLENTSFWINKPVNSALNILETEVFWLNKYLADTASMLDSLDSADKLLYFQNKLLTELLNTADRKFLYLRKSLTDQLQIQDAVAKLPNKGLRDVVITTDTTRKYIEKVNKDFLNMLDTLQVARIKYFFDTFTPSDTDRLYVIKNLRDLVTADDPLVRLSDGLVYNSIIQKRHTASATDNFTRRINFIRQPQHGFLDTVSEPDQDVHYFNKNAKAGALTVLPILRTNFISYSEQFNIESYWSKTGVNVSSNVMVAPSNVVISPSTTHDAGQLLELFYDQPLNPYANSWYQLVPGRWEASSDADLLLAATSNSTHYITTPNILQLVATENFAFAIYVKYAGQRYVRISCTVDVWADFDLVTNSIADQTASKASIQDVGNGWYLCEISNRVVSFGTAPELQILHQILLNSLNNPYGTDFIALVPELANQRVQINLLDDSRNPSFTGSGTSGVIVWGAQLEIGADVEQEISSLFYIRTTGTPASRIGFNVMPNDYDRIYVSDVTSKFLLGNRNPADAITLDETIVRNALYLRGVGSAGNQSGFTDNISLSDFVVRGLVFNRTFPDSVTEPDRDFFNIGKSLRSNTLTVSDTIRNRLTVNDFVFDSVLVGTAATGIRRSGDVLENVRFLLAKRSADLTTETDTESFQIKKTAKQGIDTFLQPGNIITWSENFTVSATSWTVRNGITAVSSTAAMAPNGTLTANRITLSGVLDPFIGQFFNVSPSGKTITSSIWAWIDAGQPTQFALFLIDNPLTQAFVSVILTLTTTPTRYNFTATFDISSSTGFYVRYDPIPPSTNTSTVYVWGAQAEFSGIMGNYQPTTTTAITPYWNNTAASSDVVRAGEYVAGIRTAGNVLENLTFLHRRSGVPFADSLTATDADRLFMNKRLIGDAVTMIDAFSFGDNLTYTYLARETDSFLIGNAVTGVRRSGDPLERLSIIDLKSARAGVNYTIAGFRDAGTPNAAFTSVTITAADTDRLIAFDDFQTFFATNRVIFDTVSIGTDTGFRLIGNNLETTKFFINKRINDTTPALDLVGIFDGLTYSYLANEQDSFSAGNSVLGLRRSGDALENTRFTFLLDGKAGVTYAVSGTTVTSNSGDRLFIGQQYGNIRLSGDPLENLKWLMLDRHAESVTVPDAPALRLNKYVADNTSALDLLNVFDGITYNWIMQRFESILTGSPAQTRYSGNALENTSFVINKTAKQGLDRYSIEGNIIPNSENVAGWASYSSNLTLATDAATAPDGTATADIITFLGAGYRYTAQGVGAHQGQTYTASAWIWSPNASKTTIGFRLNDSSDGTDQTVTSITLTTTPRRYSITRTFSSNNTSVDIGLDNRTGVGGDNTSGSVAVWGLQLQSGTVAGPYVGTTNTGIYIVNNTPNNTDRVRIGTYQSGNRTTGDGLENLRYTLLKSAKQGLGLISFRGNQFRTSEGFNGSSIPFLSSTSVLFAVDGTLSPTGTSNATKMIANTSAGRHFTRPTDYDGAALGGVTYTISCYAKAAELSSLSIYYSHDSGGATFNLGNGTANVNAGSVTASITPVINGWYRCAMTRTAPVTTGVIYELGDYFGFTGDGVSGLYIWGVQMEAAPNLGPYVRTTSTAIFYNTATANDYDRVQIGTPVLGNRIASDTLENTRFLFSKLHTDLVTLNDQTLRFLNGVLLTSAMNYLQNTSETIVVSDVFTRLLTVLRTTSDTTTVNDNRRFLILKRPFSREIVAGTSTSKQASLTVTDMFYNRSIESFRWFQLAPYAAQTDLVKQYEDINIVKDAGSLRMTSYVSDLGYFDADYVGSAFRTFT